MDGGTETAEPGAAVGYAEGRFTVDQRHCISEWDDGAASLFAVPKRQAYGSPCYEVVRGRDDFGRSVCGPDCPAFRALRRGHITGGSTVVVRTPEGRRVRLRCELTALPSSPGGAIGRIHGSDDDTPALAHDLAAVATLTTKVSTAGLRQGMEQALDFLLEAAAADAAEVFLAEPGGRGMVLSYHRGRFRRAFSQILHFMPGEGFPGLVLARREPVYSDELADDHRFLRTWVKEQGFRSYVCAPLLGLSDVVGSIGVASRRPDADLQKALHLLHWVGAPLGLAVEVGLSRLREEVGAQLQGGDGDPESHFQEVLGVVLNELARLGGADGAELYLLQQRTVGRHLTVGIGAAPHCPALQETSPSLCPALVKADGVVLHGDRTLWPPPCRMTAYPSGTRYCIPLHSEGDAVGIVRLVYRKAGQGVPSRQMALLEHMAATASKGIRDAQETLARARRADTVLRAWLQQARAGPEALGGRAPETIKPGGFTPQGSPEVVPLEVRCFGSFELYVQGKAITPAMVHRRRVLTLLKILLAHNGKAQPKDTLIEMLWPDAEPDARTGQFYVLIHELRRLVEPERQKEGWTFICNVGDRYYFNPRSRCRIDADEFKALVGLSRKAEAAGDLEAATAAYERAVELYRGDFMEDEPFAEWCWQERERLRETCLAVLKGLAALLGEAASWEDTVRYLRRALTLDPLREDIHRELMYALWATGRREEAARQYDACVRLLREELDLAPLPETERLLERIRTSPSPL